jgi:hypothetical protein
VRSALLLLLALAAGCTNSVQQDTENLRAEIVELRKKIPPEAPLWISEGPDRFDALVTDDDAGVPDFLYHHLLRKLNGMSEEEIDGLSKGTFNLDECSRDPALFRGKIWRVHGVIAELHAENAGDPRNPNRQAHAGVFFDDALRPYLFHVVQKPEIVTLRKDSVETQALFIKWIEYKSKSGRTVTAPFFVGRTLRRYL